MITATFKQGRRSQAIKGNIDEFNLAHKAISTQYCLDNFVSQNAVTLNLYGNDSFYSESIKVSAISGSRLAQFGKYIGELHSYNDCGKELTYAQAFGVEWQEIDTIRIRCIDERITDAIITKNILSFATAGCGCICEQSQKRSLQHTIQEIIELIRVWQINNPSSTKLTIELQPHEQCGAMFLALTKRMPAEIITNQNVDSAAISYVKKMQTQLRNAIFEQQEFAHISVLIITSPLAAVFPKSGHLATGALVTRLDVKQSSTSNNHTSFTLFGKVLGRNKSPLSLFAITGVDSEDDLHYLIDRITLAPVIATSESGLAHFGNQHTFSVEHPFKIYIEYNGVLDTTYLRSLTSGIYTKLVAKKIEKSVELIAIDRLS